MLKEVKMYALYKFKPIRKQVLRYIAKNDYTYMYVVYLTFNTTSWKDTFK